METKFDSTKDRLHFLLKKAGFESPAELARAMGKPASTLYSHFSGEREPSRRMAKAYAPRLKTTPEWILFGKQLNQADGITPIKTEVSIASQLVPLISFGDVEQFRTILRHGHPMSDESVHAPKSIKITKRVFACHMTDESMQGQGKENINPGDEVYVNPDAEYKEGDLVVALAPGFKTAIVRKYRVTSFDGDGQPIFDLVPLNNDFPGVRDAHANGTQIVGRVVAVTRLF